MIRIAYVIEHHNTIVVHDRLYAMRNRQHRHADKRLSNRLLNQLLRVVEN